MADTHAIGTLGCRIFPLCYRYAAYPSTTNFTHRCQLVYAQSICFYLAINLVKSSFVLQYLRLFAVIRPAVYCCYLLLFTILSVTAWGVSGVVFLCRPVRSYWNLDVHGKCISAEIHFASASIIGIVVDWAIWILPIPLVGRLKLPYRQRVGLLIVFGLGVL
jgi:hypothetical protein